MPEQEHDRLEQFFRKAANRPDVAFNEDDWKKLEARLDAAGGVATPPGTPVSKGTKIVVITAFLLSGLAFWIGWSTNILQDRVSEQVSGAQKDVAAPPTPVLKALPLEGQGNQAGTPSSDIESGGRSEHQNGALDRGSDPDLPERSERAAGLQEKISGNEITSTANLLPVTAVQDQDVGRTLPPINEDKIMRELMSLKTLASENKQEAVVKLPGAEEADAPGGKTMFEKEHASDHEHAVTPRLSLLLSFAPDFSATSLNRYSAPGKAFGAMVHYHVWSRWTFSAGVIQNSKRYTGDGEDYEPPTGYWKYYTNGIIPESIDGSCRILEFPVMVQYMIASSQKNRWTIGAGASSYLMQSESYRYEFGEPNPGAKEGWDSRGSSQFLFNMMNFTVGYEHQLIPGLMLGIEPYVKIPLEKIGWSNLKLYSTGASFTLRYTIIRNKRAIPFTAHSRGPD